MPVTIFSVEELLAQEGIGDRTPALGLKEGVMLAPSGATVRHSVSGRGGVVIDKPPTRKAELEARLRYHRTYANEAKATFEKVKSAELGGGVRKWLPEEARLFGNPDLIQLRAIYIKHVDAAKCIEAELAAMPEVQEERRRTAERARMMEAQRLSDEQREAERRRSITSITLPGDDDAAASSMTTTRKRPRRSRLRLSRPSWKRSSTGCWRARPRKQTLCVRHHPCRNSTPRRARPASVRARPRRRRPPMPKYTMPFTVDHAATFRAFCQEHGEPEDDEATGQLLFADGWRWSNNLTYRARPLPPPTDPEELRQLKIRYWTLRKQSALAIQAELLALQQELRRLQGDSSLPLMIREEGRRRAKPVPFEEYEARLGELTEALTECNQHLLN
jgi:hypothetical protein